MKPTFKKKTGLRFYLGLPPVLVLGLLFLALGCGAVDAPNNRGNPLWSVKARVESVQEGVATGNLRAAFIWSRKFVEGGIVSVAQDVPVTPQFPARFTLDLFDLPPEAAMHTSADLDGLPPYVRLAAGLMLVYDDRNDNHKLDLLPRDASGPIDYYLGPHDSYLVVFVEGDPFYYESDIKLERGLNLFRLIEGSFSNYERLALDAELTANLVDRPEEQHIMCLYPPDYHYSSGNIGAVAPSEVPQGATITCRDNGYSLYFNHIVERIQATICATMEMRGVFGTSSIPRNQTPPPGWPCTVN